MKPFRMFLTICMAAVLCLSVCTAALGTAVCFTCEAAVSFSTTAMREAVFSHVMSGEDPALVEQLEAIPEFIRAQERYVQRLSLWCYEDGEPWDGLSEDEASAIACALLDQTLHAQDIAVEAPEDYASLLRELSVPLKSALQDVFPDFDFVMQGTLRSRMHVAAALIRGTAAAGGAVCVLLCVGFLLLLCSDADQRKSVFGYVFASSALLMFVLSSSFFVKGFLFAPGMPLSLLRDMPVLCPGLLCCMAAAFGASSASCFAASVRYRRRAEVRMPQALQEHEQNAAAAVPEEERLVDEAGSEETSTSQITVQAVSAQEAITADEQMPATESIPSDAAVEPSLFAGASRYDADIQTQLLPDDMDALLARAAGPLFADITDILPDHMGNTEFLDDLQSLFEGRVES